MRESVVYQDILQEGLQKGLQQGLQQGEQKIVLRLLTRRLGEINPALETQIRRLPTSQIEALSEALLNFSSLEDLANWLRAHPGQG